MRDSKQGHQEGQMMDEVRGTISRRQLLAAAAAGATLVVAPGAVRAQSSAGTGVFSFPFFPATSGTYSTEPIGEILNALVTAHYLAATGASMSVGSATAIGFTGWELSMQQAAAAREQYYIDFLTALGAVPVATSFTFPPGFFSRRGPVLATGETSATILIAAHMTATREFAELGQPTLAKWMYQIGAELGEQRGIFRAIEAMDGVATAIPPNNKVFATDLFLYTRDIIAAYKALGLIGGAGPSTSYPGRDAVLAAAGPMAAAVIQKRPNDATSSITITGPASVNGERS